MKYSSRFRKFKVGLIIILILLVVAGYSLTSSAFGITKSSQNVKFHINNQAGTPILPVYEGSSIKDALEEGIKNGGNLNIENLYLEGKDISYLNLDRQNNKCKERKKAVLNGVNLIDAPAKYACLNDHEIIDGQFDLAKLDNANFTNSILRSSHFNQASLQNAVFTNAHLQGAEFNNSYLNNVNFTDAKLQNAKLQKADLTGAILINANLSNADLSGAILKDANLEGATLKGTLITNTDFTKADLTNVIFEPDINLSNHVDEQSGKLKPKKLPNISSLDAAYKIIQLKFDNDPSALYILEQEFRESGFMNSAREIVCAIKRSENFLSLERLKVYNLGGKIKYLVENSLEWLFFDVTNAYGSKPDRPLFILFLLIFICSIIYTYLLIEETINYSGIWLSLSEPNEESEFKKIDIDSLTLSDSAKKILEELSKYINKLTFGLFNIIKKPIKSVLKNIKEFLIAYYWGFIFSILSAFRIGFGEIEVSNWIRFLHPIHISLRSTGLFRIISGFQSLVSAYLFALWILYLLRNFF